MNAVSPADVFPRGAEARPHQFTVDDVYAMARAGLLDDDGRYELIDGVLIDMPVTATCTCNFRQA